jgi:hypothetical protein
MSTVAARARRQNHCFRFIVGHNIVPGTNRTRFFSMRVLILGGTGLAKRGMKRRTKYETKCKNPRQSIDFNLSYHNIFLYCMNIPELERRLGVFRTEHPVDRIEISEAVAHDLHVALTLKPDTIPSERFIHRLEMALGQQIRSLSLFRVRTNVVVVRFTLPRTYNEDPSETDRLQELPSLYCGAGQLVAPRARSRAMIAA